MEIVKKLLRPLGIFAAILCLASPAFAAEAVPTMNAADTVWMMLSALLVIMMTIPGLAMFYSGLVQKKGMLAIAMQVFVCCAIVSLLWVAAGYSISFTEGNAYFGGLSKAFLQGVGYESLQGTIPENTFMLF